MNMDDKKPTIARRLVKDRHEIKRNTGSTSGRDGTSPH